MNGFAAADAAGMRAQQQDDGYGRGNDGPAGISSQTASAFAAASAAATISPPTVTTNSAAPAPAPGPSPSAHLSGLMCNVHRTTGREPHPLVGATTTVLGDKLYVFGGRILSRSRPAPLTSDLYELDLIRRHWTKLETTGDVPPPRYFHSMCALGDTKMVCYGGMSLAPLPPPPPPVSSSASAGVGATPARTSFDMQPEVIVVSDIYIYDVPTRKWTFVPAQDPPEGRYAHCACVLPSSAVFTSDRAPLSALQHNPASHLNPNEGRIGISIDGVGGAEMVVVGGQDAANHYIEQISVFNLRSLRWVSTQSLGKSCGAYRSVAAPLLPAASARIGRPYLDGPPKTEDGISIEACESGSSMLIYSNYNFLDVKLELQIRSPNGALTEKTMSGSHTPPGLRFPNGGVIDTHFIVSGTYLTSSKQEYALWALDLRTLTWSRIDAGGNVFSQGSWNRGVLWNRRNTFVILGNRRRSLVDDYNHRRINFSNVCMVELEAFGFYDNPRRTAPMSAFVSASSPWSGPGLTTARKAGSSAGGRPHPFASQDLGEKMLAMREMSDMDVLCIGGERIPINSRIVARRWGPYFVQLLREGAAAQDGRDVITGWSTTVRGAVGPPNPSTTMIPAAAQTAPARGSSDETGISVSSTTMSGSMPPGSSGSGASILSLSAASGGGNGAGGIGAIAVDPLVLNAAPTPRTLAPRSRPRCLFLPHTYLTVQALLHFLYTSALPAPSSVLCNPQILCSLLQLARPYKVDGLLEAVVERLHTLLDARSAAAVFNAAAMAAGGGRGIDGSLNPNLLLPAPAASAAGALESAVQNGLGSGPAAIADGSDSAVDAGGMLGNLRINTAVALPNGRPASEELSATTSVSGSERNSVISDSVGTTIETTADAAATGRSREVWSADLSSVIGLQKRGLRGLMEARRLRERTGMVMGMGATMGVGVGVATASEGQGPGVAEGAAGTVAVAATPAVGYGNGRVGLGIAGP